MREENYISVLLIDSNNTDRNYYADRLQISSPEYVIFQAASGKTGISAFESVEIDCVVLEIDLADMSGFEILVQLVPTRPAKIPVVVLTRLTNPFILDLAVKNGAVAALYKGTTPGDDLDKTILRAVSTVQRDRKRECDTPLIQLGLLEDSLTGSPAPIHNGPFAPASLLDARSQSA